MDNKESKPMSSEALSLRPEVKLNLEENCSGSFSESYSYSGESVRDVALFVPDKGTSITQLSNVNYTMYSEGPISNVNEDRNQENKVDVPSWYVKRPNTIIHTVEFNSELSKSPSQYPLSETASEGGKPPVPGTDQHNLTGSGIPEKYFLASPKDDAITGDWQHPTSYPNEYPGSDRGPPRKNLDRTLHDSVSYLRDISNIPSNRTYTHRNDSPTSHFMCDPITSSTPVLPYKIPVSTMPQFYWTITQQRREPMGSESTDSPGFSNTPLVADSPSIVTVEQPGLRENAEYEQPCTVVDITISPATSVTVYSDTDTVSADFRLIRPPLVGQSSDGALTSMLQSSTDRQVTFPSDEHETEIFSSTPSSDNTFCEESDIDCKEKVCAELSNKKMTNTSLLHKVPHDIEESVADDLTLSHNDDKHSNGYNVHPKICAVTSSFKPAFIEREHKSINDESLNYSNYSPTVSGPSSLEYQQRIPFTVHSTENEKSYMQSRYYLLPSGLQQEALATNENNKHTKSAVSVDSNEADIESGKSGYQSDNRATSPTSVSSVSSNRRLEWDNGADIGYNAVINAANNKFINTFRSEPEGIPTRCRDNATATTNTTTVQQSSKHFHGRHVTNQESSISGVSGENSLHVLGEKVILSNSKPNIEKKKISEELNHESSEVLETNVKQQQFSVRSIGSHSSAESLSSNSTVKLVNKVGATENAEIRSSLSSPLSEPVGRTFGKLVHFDKTLLKSKSDSSTLDVSSSVTTCMPESRPASTPYINGSIYFDRCDNGHDVSQHLQGIEIGSFSPEMSHSSVDEEDAYCLSDQEVQLTLLKSNTQLEQDNSIYSVPTSVFVQGVNVPSHSVLLARSNVSKSLSNLYDSTNKISPTSMLLPDAMLPPEIRDITSLRMYLEERYQNEISELPSNTSPNENILMLDASYEEYEKDGLLTDGPKIRWYPVTGSELPQDIRDASTQTAVSYLTQHGIHPSAVNVSCTENGTQNSNQMTSVGISTKETPAIPNFLPMQMHNRDVSRSVPMKQISCFNAEKITSDTDDKVFASRKYVGDANNTLQILSKQIPIHHSHAYKDTILSNIKANSDNGVSMDLPIMHTDGIEGNTLGSGIETKCIAASIGSSLSVIPNKDVRLKQVTATSFSDSEMCETKSIQTLRSHSIPLQLPPLSNPLTEKFADKSCDAKIIPSINNSNNTVSINSMVILGTKLTNSIENEFEHLTSNGFPKLDSKCLPRAVPLVHKTSLAKQPTIQHKNDNLNTSRSTHRKTATTKLAASTSTMPSIVPVTNLAGNQCVTNISGRLYDKDQTDVTSVHKEMPVLSPKGGVFVKTFGNNHSGNHSVQYDLSHYSGNRRLPHTEIMSNVQSLGSLQGTSAPPYSSMEYSKWKVVTEENPLLESSTASLSSETENHFLLDEKLSKSQMITNGTSSELIYCNDRMKTQSLMTEIKNILSKRTTASKIMRKYAVNNEADSEKSLEHHTMPSIHSETTMESTHTGSDDAEPPSFPPHAFGSRLNIETLSPGIYGTRKYMEKYGKDINQNLKQMSSEKEIPLESENNGNLNSDTNWDISTSKPDTSSHSLSHHQISSNKSDSEPTIAHSQTFRGEESTLESEDKHIIGNSSYRLQGVGQDTSSTSVSISTQSQTISTQDQTTLSSSIDGTYKKSSVSITSSNKSNRKEASKTDSSESVLTDNHLLNRLLMADIGRSNLKPSQLAKRELEKLRHLVDRQKRSYIRRLQREVQRLERFEEVFLSESLKRLSSSSHCTLNITNPKANDTISSRNGYHSGNGSSISVPDSFLTSGNDIKNIAVAKTRTRKISSRKGSASTNISRMMKHSPLQVNDFGQNYPTPQLSFSETEKEITDQRISVGIQTSVLQPTLENKKLLTKRTESRFFITLDPSYGKQKKGETARSSKYKDKTLYVRKRRPSSHTIPKCIKKNIAWFVPINAKKQCIRNSSRSRLQGPGCISLQEAFHLNCGHVIKHSQARLIRISKLADLRQKRTALAMEKARIASQLKIQKEQELQKEEEEEKRRVFTHEEMREQTEKVYKKLPEVVEKKEKKRRDQQYKTNRLMAQIYNKKLQEQVLRGKVNWAITQSCFDGDE